MTTSIQDSAPSKHGGDVRPETAADYLTVTFVLPGISRSGGVRVTMEMAELLRTRGHHVRVVYRVRPRFSKDRLRATLARLTQRFQGVKDDSWLEYFRGSVQEFTQLGDLAFQKGEVVVAVGTRTMQEVHELKQNVRKVRYCHGFMDHALKSGNGIWSLPLPTISVSPALVPLLERCTGQSVLAVVPNGIDPKQYFVENRTRDGIGLIFNDHPIKAPETAIAIIEEARKRFPDVPWYCFGQTRRPNGCGRKCHYWRYPSVERSREIYNRCKVWLVTSRNEGFCLPILEATACGCAVITSNHMNAAELVRDGENGFIVPFGDVEAYLGRIQRLLTHEVERRRLVENGLPTVQRFSWDVAVSQMERALRSLVQSASD